MSTQPGGPPHGGAGQPFHAHPQQPVVIDVGSNSTRKALIGGMVAGVIGLVAIISAIAGAVTGGTGTAIAVGAIGAVFLTIGLLPVLMWRKISRPRKLVIEPQGVRWDDPRGKPWAVAWPELAAVAVSRTVERRIQAEDHLRPRRIMVRLDLFPADPGFRARHPEMAHLWEFHRVRNGYRLPLGSTPKFVPLIEEGMRQFQPRVYRGVVDEGFTVGLV